MNGDYLILCVRSEFGTPVLEVYEPVLTDAQCRVMAASIVEALGKIHGIDPKQLALDVVSKLSGQEINSVEVPLDK